MSGEIQVWKPSTFQGSDLLPVHSLQPSGEKLVGRENISQEDMILPTLRLLQGQSSAVTDQIEGAIPGVFLHSASQQIFKPPLRVLFVAHSKSNALYPKQDNPRHAGLEKCMARDAVKGDRYGFCEECRKCLDWGPNGEPPLGARSHNFVAMTEVGPAILRFSSMAYRAAREFVTTWNMSSKNLWAHPVVVRVKRQQKQLPTGQMSTFFIGEPVWQQSEQVPPEFKEAALKLHEQINQAQQDGRFGGDDEAEGVVE